MPKAKWIPNVLWSCVVVVVIGSEMCAADGAFTVPAGERQLFLDDVGIAKIENLRRTMHTPAKKGAVIRPILNSRDGGAVLTLCPPMWIPEKNVYRIWLLSSVGYAESRDGIVWTRTLDPPAGITYLQGALHDPDDPDPSRRFKGMTYGRGGLQPVVSDDVVWRKCDAQPIPAGDTNFLYFDEQERLFIATVRGGGPGRAICLSTSKDFVHWTQPELIFHADGLDQELGRKRIAARLADPTLQQPFYNKPSSYKVDV